MHNYKDRPLSKYVPDSPPPSPHMYQEDSFEAEELSRSLPHPPIPLHNYQLTFKKEAQGQYFMGNTGGLPTRTLFATTEQTILHSIRAPLADYHHKSMEELAELPFADLMSLDLPDILRQKLGLIGQILQVKRMRLKMSNIGVNIRCLRVKEGLSHQDKHRLYLLQLLWKQLSKKIFLEALKLNLAQAKYLRQFAQKQQEMQVSSQQEMSNRINEEEQEYDAGQYSKQRNSIWQRQEEEEQDGSDSENWQQKLMVFSHNVTPIFHKQLFFAFTRISQAKVHKNTIPNPNPKSTFELEYESIPLISRPNITDDSQNSFNHKEQSQLEENEVEHEISESRLQQLYIYIEELHEQCAESQNLLKRYFIKLKINLLESIAHSMLKQIRAPIHPLEAQEDLTEQQQRSSPGLSPRQEHTEEVLQNEDANMNSRYTSQLSQDGSLKAEKRLLKEYLRDSRIKRLFYLLKANCDSKKFESICADMRTCSLLNLAFRALLQNAKQQKLSRQMEGYYEQTANDQYEDDGPSKFFYRTNILYKYFQRLKDNHRNQRIVSILDVITIKLAFRTLKSFCFQEQRHKVLVDRYRSNFQARIMFKCFAGWKQVHLNEIGHNERFHLYLAIKERDTLHHYFSILKLNFKKGLVRQRKTDQYYHQQLREKVFMALKCLYEENREFNERTATLEEHLRFCRGTSIMRKLKQFYSDYTAFQRFSIKEEKLRRTLIRLHALQGIKQWRKTQIRKQAYAAIEMKLVRFKNKQRKREIFSCWIQRARQLLYNSGSNQSESHKDWLVKYYGDLCSVLPS